MYREERGKQNTWGPKLAAEGSRVLKFMYDLLGKQRSAWQQAKSWESPSSIYQAPNFQMYDSVKTVAFYKWEQNAV